MTVGVLLFIVVVYYILRAEIRAARPEGVADHHGRRVNTPLKQRKWSWNCTGCRVDLGDDFDIPQTPKDIGMCGDCGRRFFPGTRAEDILKNFSEDEVRKRLSIARKELRCRALRGDLRLAPEWGDAEDMEHIATSLRELEEEIAASLRELEQRSETS